MSRLAAVHEASVNALLPFCTMAHVWKIPDRIYWNHGPVQRSFVTQRLYRVQVGCTLGRINAKDYAKRNGSEECQYDDLEIDDRRDFYKRRNNVPGNDAQEYADNSGTACHQDRFGQKLQYYVFLLRPKGL